MRRYQYHTVISTQPIWTNFGKFAQKMVAPRSSVYWTVLAVFIRFLNLMMSQSCVIFQTLDNVTMDTSQCLFQNLTEPVSNWLCLKSCHTNPRVSIIIYYVCWIKTKKNIPGCQSPYVSHDEHVWMRLGGLKSGGGAGVPLWWGPIHHG